MSDDANILTIGDSAYPLVRFDGLGTVYALDDPALTESWTRLVSMRDKFTKLKESDDTAKVVALVDEWRDTLAQFITEGHEYWDDAHKRGWLGVKNLAAITEGYGKHVGGELPTTP